MTETTNNIQAFFEFIYHRQEIWHKRTILKLPKPWSADAIFRDYKFCNVYRELDGGTSAITKYLSQPDYSPQQKLFNIIAYRFFNRRDTIENTFGGFLNPADFDFKTYEQRLDKLKEQRPLFSNAYLISSHPYNSDYRPKDKHVQILLMLDGIKFKLNEIIAALQAENPQQGLNIINKYVALSGPFLSGQILLDITYAGDIVEYTADDFLIVGPGAHWGLNIIFNRKLSKKEADEKCRYLYSLQLQAFAEMKAGQGLDWDKVRWQNPAYPNAPYLCLHDIQNSLCEFRKYWRLKHGEKAKKRYFKSIY